MPDPTYSVYFTGHWLSEPDSGSRMELLHRLFPHAGDERLEHFLDRRRVLLIHGESLEAAKRVVMTLHEHGLQCEIAEDAEVPPDVKAAAVLPRLSPAASRPVAAAPAVAAGAAPAHEEEFTPRGQKILRALMVVTAILVLAASWSAWRRLSRGPAADLADMPSVCATDTQTTWYGSTRAHVLVCVAKTAAGARYRLTLSCDRKGAVGAALALYDSVGAPRVPAWEAGAGGAQRSIRWASGNGDEQRTLLRRAESAHVGTLPGFDTPATARLLAATSFDIADVFDGEVIRFDLESARWYIEYFSGTCGLTTAAR
ncbi:MAG: hypothetical protein WC809_17475 [Sinimarinibacterium sp.]|jgi:hypothetical protein